MNELWCPHTFGRVFYVLFPLCSKKSFDDKNEILTSERTESACDLCLLNYVDLKVQCSRFEEVVWSANAIIEK